VADEQPIVVVLPRFTRWMKVLSLYVAGVWLAEIVLGFVIGDYALLPLAYLALIPARVFAHLEVWRIPGYALIEDPKASGAIWTVLSFWWFGSQIERETSAARVFQLLAAGTLGGAVVALLAALVAPASATGAAVGLGPGASALFSAWGYLYAEQPVSFFGMGRMKGKHLALGLGALTLLLALLNRSTDGFASVGGLLAGPAVMWTGRRRGGGGRPRKTGGPGWVHSHRTGSRFKVVIGGRTDNDKKLWN
jgi:membrane associated rhomboid family serine protease